MNVRPTALGWKGALFAVAVVGAFLATPYHNLFFLLLVHLAVVALLGACVARRDVVEWSLRPRAAVAAGDDVRVRLDATGTPSTPAVVQWSLKWDESERRGLAVVDGEGAFQISVAVRGRYHLQVRSVSDGPYGLFRRVGPWSLARTLIVHPKPSEDVAVPAGSVASSREKQGGGDRQPGTLREYRSGDDPRRVQWRASARRGDLVVQEWEDVHDETWRITLDRTVDADTFERALSDATALGLIALESARAVHVVAQGHDGTYGEGAAPFDALWAWLSDVDVLETPAEAVS